MKKTLTIVSAALFISITGFAQIHNSNTAPGSALLTQITPGTRLTLLQNPVKGMINFQISNPYNNRYEISLYSMNGQKITSILYDHPAGMSLKTLYIPHGVKGMYYLVVTGKDERHSTKVLIE